MSLVAFPEALGKTPFVDPRTGVLTPVAFRYLQMGWERMGGALARTNTELELLTTRQHPLPALVLPPLTPTPAPPPTPERAPLPRTPAERPFAVLLGRMPSERRTEPLVPRQTRPRRDRDTLQPRQGPPLRLPDAPLVPRSTVGGVVGLGNPTALVGLSPVNGHALTALRSDGAPALDQAITPTWTGQHLFAAKVGMGNTTPQVSLDVGTTAAVIPNTWLAHVGAEATGLLLNLSVGSDTASRGATLSLEHYRGSHASPTALSADDQIGSLLFVGYTDARRSSAAIRAYAETGYGSSGTDSPGRLSFWTVPDGSSTVLERMRIDSQGRVGIGTTAPTSVLHVVGLPVYANNAAAVAGGLTAGALYRTGGDPDPVCVVH